jgi:hypothetical protein
MTRPTGTGGIQEVRFPDVHMEVVELIAEG